VRSTAGIASCRRQVQDGERQGGSGHGSSRHEEERYAADARLELRERQGGDGGNLPPLRRDDRHDVAGVLESRVAPRAHDLDPPRPDLTARGQDAAASGGERGEQDVLVARGDRERQVLVDDRGVPVTLDHDEAGIAGKREHDVLPHPDPGRLCPVDRPEVQAGTLASERRALEGIARDVSDGLDVARGEIDPPHEREIGLGTGIGGTGADEAADADVDLVAGALRSAQDVAGIGAGLQLDGVEPLSPRHPDGQNDRRGHGEERCDQRDDRGKSFAHRVIGAPDAQRHQLRTRTYFATTPLQRPPVSSGEARGPGGIASVGL
jgi:hypothetical protein